MVFDQDPPDSRNKIEHNNWINARQEHHHRKMMELNQAPINSGYNSDFSPSRKKETSSYNDDWGRPSSSPSSSTSPSSSNPLTAEEVEAIGAAIVGIFAFTVKAITHIGIIWPFKGIRSLLNSRTKDDGNNLKAGAILAGAYASAFGIYAATEIHETQQAEKYPAISVYRDDGYGFFGGKNSDPNIAATLAQKECSPGFYDGRYLGCHPVESLAAGQKACIAVARMNDQSNYYTTDKFTDPKNERFSQTLAKCEPDPHRDPRTTCPMLYAKYFCNDDKLQSEVEKRAKANIAKGQKLQREEYAKTHYTSPTARQTFERFAIASTDLKIHSAESRTSAVVASLKEQSCVTVTIKDGLIGNFLKVSANAGGKPVTGYVWAYDVDIQASNAPKPQACVG